MFSLTWQISAVQQLLSKYVSAKSPRIHISCSRFREASPCNRLHQESILCRNATPKLWTHLTSTGQERWQDDKQTGRGGAKPEEEKTTGGLEKTPKKSRWKGGREVEIQVHGAVAINPSQEGEQYSGVIWLQLSQVQVTLRLAVSCSL